MSEKSHLTIRVALSFIEYSVHPRRAIASRLISIEFIIGNEKNVEESRNRCQKSLSTNITASAENLLLSLDESIFAKLQGWRDREAQK